MKKVKFIFLLFLIILCGCNSSKNYNLQNLKLLKNYVVSLVAVGDNLIHETVYLSAQTGEDYDFKPMLRDIKPYIQKYDLKFINQETIIGGKEIGLSTYPCFNSPFELGDALIDTGFNLISIANNHTLDRGEKAVINSIKYWNSQPVIFSGAVENEDVSQVKLFEINNVRFAFAAYTYGTNGIVHPQGKVFLANIYSNQKAKHDLENLKEVVDVIIVSMHWGDEYQNYPNNTQKEQAKYLSKLGVDIIIGHHPHVIQPIDIIENESHKTLVIYSLGNFLSDQKGIDRLIGMAVSVDINKTILDDKVNIDLINLEAKLLYRYKDYLSNFSVKLFQNLNEELLKDYEYYFEDKKNLIRTYVPSIKVS